MRKIILDFYDVAEELAERENSGKREDCPVRLADTKENSLKDHRELVHDYIAEKMDFPDYYGRNLDSLYDLLLEICEPTAVGFFIPTVDFDDLSIDLMLYLDRVKKVFEEAEAGNPENLAVIMAESASVMPEDADPDAELDELMKDLIGGKN